MVKCIGIVDFVLTMIHFILIKRALDSKNSVHIF